MKLDHYLQEELVLKGQNFNVLIWWMSNGPKFLTLRRITGDIYAIPISFYHCLRISLEWGDEL
jgi:hAT family C-terminal dimerisation region